MAQREGHQVEIVSASSDGFPGALPGGDTTHQEHRQLVKGVPVVRLAASDAQVAAERFGKWFGKQRFDAVHGVFAHPADWPFPLDAEALAPLVVTLSALPAATAADASTVTQSWMRRADVCVVPSPLAASRWREVWPESAFHVMPHGVDLLALIQARGVQMHGITPHSLLTLLCVGTFDPSSGVVELMRAFTTTVQAELRLHMVGRVDETSAYGQEILGMARSEPRIRFTSMQPPSGLAGLSDPFDAVWLPGLAPTDFSSIAQECAALGIACFATHPGASPLAEVSQDLVQRLASDDVSAIATAISQWARAFRRSRQPTLDAAIPLRIEEEAFLYEGLYRRMAFERSRRTSTRA
jgi:glycosyltransferase involved in cell wall biosynthesis